jgi:hypothetical protein
MLPAPTHALVPPPLPPSPPPLPPPPPPRSINYKAAFDDGDKELREPVEIMMEPAAFKAGIIGAASAAALTAMFFSEPSWALKLSLVLLGSRIVAGYVRQVMARRWCVWHVVLMTVNEL